MPDIEVRYFSVFGTAEMTHLSSGAYGPRRVGYEVERGRADDSQPSPRSLDSGLQTTVIVRFEVEGFRRVMACATHGSS